MSPPAGTGISTSNPSPCDDDDDVDHNKSPGRKEGNEPKIETRTASEDNEDASGSPVVVSPVNTPPSQDDDDDNNEDNETKKKERSEEDSFVDASDKLMATPAFPHFFRAGLSKKASPWALQSWAALSLTLDGRDKITKVLQYATRMLGWWLAGKSPYHSDRFLNIYKSLATCRKAFRIGRSLVEFDKLRSMGLFGLILWHLQAESADDEKDHERSGPPKAMIRRASSNVGWGPMTLAEEQESRRSLYRSLSSMAYRRMYRPLLSRMSQTWGSLEEPSMELWVALGTALKLVGLMGFWAGDNINFLSTTGAFDNYKLSEKDRLARRKRLATAAGMRANQAYFLGAIAGLFVNVGSYWTFTRKDVKAAEKEYRQTVEESPDDQERAKQRFIKVQEKQFSLFVALLKVRNTGYLKFVLFCFSTSG